MKDRTANEFEKPKGYIFFTAMLPYLATAALITVTCIGARAFDKAGHHNLSLATGIVGIVVLTCIAGINIYGLIKTRNKDKEGE